MKVLVVDDDLVLQKLLATQLERLGYEVTVCSDGRSAWEAWERDRHPIVLLDLMLPEMDGRQLSGRLRAHPQGDECIIVVITARDSLDDLHPVLDAGADDYLVKPIKLDVLTIRMAIADRQYRALLARKRAERGLRDSEMQLSHLLANAPVLIFGVDREGRIVLARGREFEVSPEGQRVGEVFDDPDLARDLQRALRGPAFNAVRRLGNRTVDIWYAPRVGPDGTVIGVTAIATDVTARVLAEDRLRKSVDDIAAERDEIRSILHRDRSGIIIVDADERVTFHNPAARRLLQVSGEVFSHPWDEVLPLTASDLARIRGQMGRRENERERQRIELRSGGGKRTHLDIEVCNAPRVMGRWAFFAYDVTESVELRRQFEEDTSSGEFIGRSPTIQALLQQLREAAQVDWTILIEGPRGVGRSVGARSIHQNSRRRSGPFVVLDCEVLAESILEDWWEGRAPASDAEHTPWARAAGGTLFVDGIEALSLAAQGRLMRWLEERELGLRTDELRIIVGSRRDLADAVERGEFLAPLLSRLRAMRLRIPPLRERRDDIPTLAHAFVRQAALRTGGRESEISREAMHVLLHYRWPGNVRELRATIDAAILASSHSRIEVADLPPEVRTLTLPTDDTAPAVDERQQIMDAIQHAGGNRKRAATLLGMSRATLYRRLDRYGISRDDERNA